MSKKRCFKKRIIIQNFKVIKTEQLLRSDNLTGKSLKEVATVEVEIFFTPKGFRIEIHLISPMLVWDFEQTCKIKGITESNPEGDLTDENFDTELSAMHFITRRLSKLGWEAEGVWTDG